MSSRCGKNLGVGHWSLERVDGVLRRKWAGMPFSCRILVSDLEGGVVASFSPGAKKREGDDVLTQKRRGDVRALLFLPSVVGKTYGLKPRGLTLS